MYKICLLIIINEIGLCLQQEPNHDNKDLMIRLKEIIYPCKTCTDMSDEETNCGDQEDYKGSEESNKSEDSKESRGCNKCDEDKETGEYSKCEECNETQESDETEECDKCEESDKSADNTELKESNETEDCEQCDETEECYECGKNYENVDCDKFEEDDKVRDNETAECNTCGDYDKTMEYDKCKECREMFDSSKCDEKCSESRKSRDSNESGESDTSTENYKTGELNDSEESKNSEKGYECEEEGYVSEENNKIKNSNGVVNCGDGYDTGEYMDCGESTEIGENNKYEKDSKTGESDEFEETSKESGKGEESKEDTKESNRSGRSKESKEIKESIEDGNESAGQSGESESSEELGDSNATGEDNESRESTENSRESKESNESDNASEDNKDDTVDEIKNKFNEFKEKLISKVCPSRAILMTGASLTASVFVVQVAVLPLLFKYSKSVQRKMVFSNCINYPRNLNYESPSSVNIVGGRNLNFEFQSKVDDCPIKIGIWHIIPCSMFRQVFILRDAVTLETELIEALKTTRKTVVLYCHGNSNHRASPHRLQLYKVFQELDFHIVTFDYRGYGDSTYIRPTERGVVEDCLHVYSWLINSLDTVNPPTIVLWGHSLGSAVASNMVAHLPQLCQEHGLPPLPAPDVLVLESPFNNLTDEIASHPFSKLVSWLPYYKETFVKPFSVSPEFAFTTDQYLAKAPHVPTLMLHCKGDKIVPYELAVKLHESVRRSRGRAAAPLVFHSFEKGLGLGHNNICEANDLQLVVRNFLTMAKKKETK